MDNEENTLLKNLEGRKRDHKVEITDVAIEKVPYIEYKCIPENHYKALQQIAKLVLQVSKNENNSDEVSIVYSLECEKLIQRGEAYIGVSLGDEDTVNPVEDVNAYHIVHTAMDCVVLCFHNHPNLSKHSLEDIKFLLRNESVKMIVVITNLGAISYLVKSENYDWDMARQIYNDAVTKHNKARKLRDLQDAAEYFLKNCYKANIIYEDK